MLAMSGNIQHTISSEGNRLVGMWVFVAGTVVAMILLFAVGRVVVLRRENRQRLLMRVHLNRISRDWE